MRGRKEARRGRDRKNKMLNKGMEINNKNRKIQVEVRNEEQETWQGTLKERRKMEDGEIGKNETKRLKGEMILKRRNKE